MVHGGVGTSPPRLRTAGIRPLRCAARHKKTSDMCVGADGGDSHCPLLHGRVRPSRPPHAVFFRDPPHNNSNK